jgi:hypothetical protein
LWIRIKTYPGSLGTSSATPFEDCDCCGSRGEADSMVIFQSLLLLLLLLLRRKSVIIRLISMYFFFFLEWTASLASDSEMFLFFCLYSLKIKTTILTFPFSFFFDKQLLFLFLPLKWICGYSSVGRQKKILLFFLATKCLEKSPIKRWLFISNVINLI